MKYLQDISVVVLGLGESGLAMARWCVRCGARVTVWDSRTAPPRLDVLRAQLPHVRFTNELPPLDGARLVLKSPGLAPHDERIAPLVKAARAAKVPVAGELDLFVRALADLKVERGYAPKVLAVTGTNGKTTTTSLAALLVERAGLRVASAGNIGPTMLDSLGDALDREPAAGEQATLIDDRTETSQPIFEHLPDVWVLELSSFQLDGVQGFEPDAAVVLNVTQDHLDWHGSMDAYVAAKARIFGRHAVMVVNRGDPLVEAMVPLAVKPPKGRAPKPRKVVRFGVDAPRRAGDFGLVVENGMAWLVRAVASDTAPRRGAEEDEEFHLQRLMPADALKLRGRHNAANALAALALATAIGCPLAPMLHGLREYGGEPHRVEFVGTVYDIEAFDDSKGTNVGATVAALDGLGADKAPAKLAVVLGGDGKGQDFSALAAPIARHARAVALIGRDAEAIGQALAATGVPLQRHANLEEATRWCFAQARAGDAVLLSPACASLDMFRNYGHRADVFVSEVRAIAAEAGEALL